MKKSAFTLLFLISAIHFSHGQCNQVFVPMDLQPHQNAKYDKFRCNSPYENYYCYAWEQNGMLPDSTPVNYLKIYKWDNISWTALPTITTLVEPNNFDHMYNILEYKGRLFLGAHLSNVLGIGKDINMLELKGNKWDTLPGNITVNSNAYFNLMSNDHGIYRENRDGAATWAFEKYNFTTSGWDSICSGDWNLLAHAGKHRIALSHYKKVNGETKPSFLWLDSNNNIHFPVGITVPTKDELVLGIDPSNDHIYFGKEGLEMELFEFTDKVISSRKTTTGYSQIPDDDRSWRLNISKGDIGWVFITQDYKRHNLFLCRGYNRWRNIENNIFGDVITATRSGHIVVLPTGIASLNSGIRISGRYIVETDSNCIYNEFKDLPRRLKNVTFRSQDYWSTALSDDSGFYELSVPKGKYDLKVPKSGFNTCTPLTYNLIKPGEMEQVLSMMPAKTSDLILECNSIGRLRWNASRNVEFRYINEGPACDSAHFEFQLPKGVSSVSSSGIHYDPVKNTVRGSVAKIKFYGSGLINFTIMHDTAMFKPGSTLCLTGKMYLKCKDADSSNNKIKCCFWVVYSYDPNYKEVNEKLIPVNQAAGLEYVVHFQNEGNDYAEDVVVKDTLSAFVDLESLNIFSASHQYSASLKGRILIVTFPRIFLLPKKQDEAKSQGFFAYRINTFSGLGDGMEIKNRASIYFDLNAPVLTNQTITLVSKNQAGIKTPKLSSISIFPNPADDHLTIRNGSLNTKMIHIHDLMGREMFFEKLAGNNSINISTIQWKPGLYILTDDQGNSQKLILR